MMESERRYWQEKYGVPVSAPTRDPEDVSWQEHQARLLVLILGALERIEAKLGGDE